MNRKIPSGAFEHYFGLGAERSYQAVASKYGVSKRAVTQRAKAEGWNARLASLESRARERVDERLLDALEEMNERHIKTCRVIQAKALETLRGHPLSSAMNAVRALDLAMKQERLIHGEPTDRTVTSVEEVIRREYSRWMVAPPLGDGAGEQAEAVEGCEPGEEQDDGGDDEHGHDDSPAA